MKTLKPGQIIYHKQRKEYGVFVCYNDQSTEINDTCWVILDDEEQHVSVEQIEESKMGT